MRRRIGWAALALILTLGLCGCSGRGETDSGKLQVVCTLFPYYDFARQIGGEDVEATLLLGAGRESHSFEPTPLDVIRISRADVFVYNGGESEQWVEEVLRANGQQIGAVLTMMDEADTLPEEIVEGMQTPPDDGEDEGEDVEYDEHIWTSPAVAGALCRRLAEVLSQADPAHAEGYQARLEAYLQELTALDDAFTQAAAQARHKTLIFGDRFPFLYFCRAYGWDYRAAFHGCAADTEPSLATLRYLIDRVRAEDIPAVYTIELSNQKIAQAIAETTGAKVLTLQSCQSISRADFAAGKGYVELMWENVEALREGTA